MKRISLIVLLVLVAALISSCGGMISPAASQPVVDLGIKWSVHDQLYVAYDKSEVSDGTVIYFSPSDSDVANFFLPSFTGWDKWYTKTDGGVIEHNSKFFVPKDEVKNLYPVQREDVVGIAPPPPTPTPIPAGTIVFNYQYQVDGTTIYISDFYDHCVTSYGYGLPDQGGVFDEWYTIENGLAAKHTGRISAEAAGFKENKDGWVFNLSH